MFHRRVVVLTCILSVAAAILIGRLAQIQVGWRDELPTRDGTRRRGQRLLDPVRGGIYTRD